MRSQIVERIIRSAQPIINKLTLESQRSGQTAFFRMKPHPKGIEYTPVDDFSMKAEWVVPENADKDRIIFYTHGGGYGMGDLVSSRALIAPVAKKCGMKAFSFEYRLAPESPFPAALEDSLAAYDYILECGYKPENIVIFGESAGGGLVFSTMLSLRKQGKTLPACAVAVSPWADLTETNRSYIKNGDKDPLLSAENLSKLATAYVGDDSPLNPLISPAFATYDENYPPVLIQVGDKEVLYDDSIAVRNALVNGGVNTELEIYADMWHVFHIWQIEQADLAIQSIADFIHKHSGNEELGMRN
ncbi:MAG: alpha/beta hydrolase [Acutalibacteraceae bacterium]